MDTTTFFNKYNGKYLDYDKHYGSQCTDLMRQYVKEVDGFSPYVAIPTTGYAKNIFKNFVPNKYYEKILNKPNNIPRRGDIIFWSGYYGHVAIIDRADLYIVYSFDQNYPYKSPCRFVKHGTGTLFHGYRGCLGWLRKKA